MGRGILEEFVVLEHRKCSLVLSKRFSKSWLNILLISTTHLSGDFRARLSLHEAWLDTVTDRLDQAKGEEKCFISL